MKIDGKKLKIEIEEIDLTDTSFRISYFYDNSKLLQSIKTSGIINFPILKKKNGKFIIVSGFRRIEVLAKCGYKELEGFISDETDFKLFESVLYENLSIREFNLPEKMHILFKLHAFYKLDPETIETIYFPLLDLNDSKIWFDFSKEFVAYEKPVQELFIQNEISYNLIEFYLKLNAKDKACLLHLIKETKSGKNKQKDLITTLSDLMKQKNLSLEELMTALGLFEILKMEKINHNQKADKISKILFHERFPSYSLAEENFKKWVNSLKLSGKAKIFHTPYFENNDYELYFKFKQASDLDSITDDINKIKNRFRTINKIIE